MTKVEQIIDLIENADSSTRMYVNNVYCRENDCNNDEIYVNDEEFFKTNFSNFIDAVRAVHSDEYDYQDSFVKFNYLGNLCSLKSISIDDMVDSLENIAKHILENIDTYNMHLDGLDDLKDD